MNKLAQVPIGERFGSPFGQTQGLADLVSIILSNAMIIAGVILLAMLVGGGAMMVFGAGQNKPEMGARGKTAATSAVIGFAIIFTAYWIIALAEYIFDFSILSPNVPGLS